jgi:hypothetical protein
MLASVVIVAVSLSPKQVFAFRNTKTKHKKRKTRAEELCREGRGEVLDYWVKREATDRFDSFDHSFVQSFWDSRSSILCSSDGRREDEHFNTLSNVK